MIYNIRYNLLLHLVISVYLLTSITHIYYIQSIDELLYMMFAMVHGILTGLLTKNKIVPCCVIAAVVTCVYAMVIPFSTIQVTSTSDIVSLLMSSIITNLQFVIIGILIVF